MAIVAILAIPGLPSVRADVALQLRATASVGGTAPLAPLSAASVVSGAGTCLSYANATVPFGPGSSRANLSVTEPRGCPGGTLLTFLPAPRFVNGLTTPAGHLLRSSLTLTSMNGSTAMVRRAQFYLQHVGGANALITTRILVRNGVIVTPQTSAGTVASPNTYGIGLHLLLNHLPTTGRATLNLTLVSVLDDGGIVRVLDQELVTVLLVY